MLNLYDAAATEWKKLTIHKDQNCPVCSEAAI